MPLRIFESFCAAGAGLFVVFLFVMAGAVLLLLFLSAIKPQMDRNREEAIQRAREQGVRVVKETPRKTAR